MKFVYPNYMYGHTKNQEYNTIITIHLCGMIFFVKARWKYLKLFCPNLTILTKNYPLLNKNYPLLTKNEQN